MDVEGELEHDAVLALSAKKIERIYVADVVGGSECCLEAARLRLVAGSQPDLWLLPDWRWLHTSTPCRAAGRSWN